jgi:peptidoglycan/LPS O-acetylase OafA/YrhL
MSLGGVAVDCFFFISGLLVTHSLIRKSDVLDFAVSRLLRVFPAAIVAALVITLLLGPVVSKLDFVDYFSQPQVYIHLAKNSILVLGADYYLPGVFNDVPYANVVNGSLWTLPYEVRLYAAILILWFFMTMFTSKGKTAVLFRSIFSTFVAGTIAYYAFAILSGNPPAIYFKLVLFFLIGGAFACFPQAIRVHWIFPALLGVLILTAPLIGHAASKIGWMILMPPSIIYISYGIKSRILSGFPKSDLSYGVYIYAFPIQQTLMYLNTPESPLELTILSSFFTLLIAAISWTAIEKPALNLKSHVLGVLRSKVSTNILEGR